MGESTLAMVHPFKPQVLITTSAHAGHGWLRFIREVYVAKPVNPGELLAVVASLANRTDANDSA